MEHAEHSTPTLDHDPQRGPGYEVRDTNVRTIAIAGVVLVLLIVVVNLGLLAAYWRLYDLREKKETPKPAEKFEVQMRLLRENEKNVLENYSVDPKTGVVRIPIDRAIELVAERGVPHGKGPQTEIQINGREKK